VVEAAAAGIRAGGHPLLPGSRRLLRAGERAELRGAFIAVEAGGPEGTRAEAAALLRDAAAGREPIAGAHLLVLTGPAAGARHRLGPDQTIGRGRAATIVLPDPQATRVHARVRVGPAGARLEDLGSKNGLRVNGVRIEGSACPVREGDEVVIGETALVLLGLGRPPAERPSRPRRPPRHVVAAALLALSAAALALAAG
jgi:hypothetical protein